MIRVRWPVWNRRRREWQEPVELFGRGVWKVDPDEVLGPLSGRKVLIGFGGSSLSGEVPIEVDREKLEEFRRDLPHLKFPEAQDRLATLIDDPPPWSEVDVQALQAAARLRPWWRS